MNGKVLEALEYINVQDLHYFEWINVGMALKAEGFDCSVWDNWSQNDTRYKKGACQKKWETFKNSGLSGGTIIKMAKDRGYSSFYFTIFRREEKSRKRQTGSISDFRKSEITSGKGEIFGRSGL